MPLIEIMLPGFFIQMLKKPLAGVFVITLLVCTCVAQQGSGLLKGSVTDQLGSLVVSATIVARDGKGAEKKTTTNSTGNFEIRSLAPGYYDLQVVAFGFEPFRERQVEIKSGRTTSLDLQLSIAAVEQSVIVDQTGVSTDADRNADALVLRDRELEALPNDPEALAAALQAMAGPSNGEQGAQVKVDGFSNGQIPPKEAIREVRINQNPYSAENEYPGWGGIEIFTQPGSDKFHGGASFGFNDESLNSRNPFTLKRAPYQQRGFSANLTGPIKSKRASFALYIGRNASDSNSVVNATILDPTTLEPMPFNQTLVTPQASFYMGTRGDLKINKKHTLVGNFELNKSHQDRQGIGGFSLPSRAYSGRRSYYNLQMTETAILNEKTINETRLQLTHSIFQQAANTALPALNVQDSFFGGGSQVGSASNRQDRLEVQNFTSWSAGRHFLKIGGRLRYVHVDSISPANFGGTYTFAGGTETSSLERYRRTLLLQRQGGLTGADIRSMGGGATQFSIAGGNPKAEVRQRDFSFYAQDDWKVRPNFTVSPGLRYENQNNISSNWNFAPRIGFAWSPTFGSKKKAPPVTESKNTTEAKSSPSTPPKPATSSQAKTVVRGGFGVFYYRISEDLTLNALRFNGLNQQLFVVTDPSVLDRFPIADPAAPDVPQLVPAINSLAAFAQPQTRRFINPNLAPLASLRSSFSLEHQFPYNLKLSLNYSHSHTLRALRTVNINAPLGGTYNPALPTSGVRPLGQTAGNILEYQANGRSINDSVGVSINGTVKKVNFWGSYYWNKGRSTDTGTSGSPVDAYDFSREWGRPQYDARHFFYASGDYRTAFGLSLNTFVIANSGNPFNITTGKDTNGDTLFTERPAFATDLGKPGVIVTPLGAFDPNPAPGQRIIPRNFGHGPGMVSVNLGVAQVIKFGPAIPPKTSPAPATVVASNSGANSGKPPAKQPIQRPYSLSFSIYASNLFNRTNKGNPVGNMASPFFLKSTATSGQFFFGPGGGGGAAGNRQVSLRVRFSF
jgi:hypothetical protein